MRDAEEIITAIVKLTEDDCYNCPCIDTCKGDNYKECTNNITNWVNGN